MVPKVLQANQLQTTDREGMEARIPTLMAVAVLATNPNLPSVPLRINLWIGTVVVLPLWGWEEG